MLSESWYKIIGLSALQGGILLTWLVYNTYLPKLLTSYGFAPAVSLIGRYASATELPIAMSFLTVVGGLIGAIKPVSQNFLLSLGAPIAFTSASIVLLAATALLRYFNPPLSPNLKVIEHQPLFLANIGLLIGMGWGIAWGSRCLFETLPKIIKLNLPQVDPALAMVSISILIAISALPGGILAAKYSNQRIVLVGLSATLIAFLGLVFLPIKIIIAIAIIIIICCFSWVTNGMIPLAINLLPASRSGLAVGLYFGGFSAGISSFSYLFNPVSILTPLLGATFGAIGFSFAGGCVWRSFKFANNRIS